MNNQAGEKIEETYTRNVIIGEKRFLRRYFSVKYDSNSIAMQIGASALA